FPVHLVQFVAHDELLSHQVTGKSPLLRLELRDPCYSRRPRSSTGTIMKRPGRENLCYRCRKTPSPSRTMKDNPIGSIRLTTLLVARSFSAPPSRSLRGIPRGRFAWWRAPPRAASPTTSRA